MKQQEDDGHIHDPLNQSIETQPQKLQKYMDFFGIEGDERIRSKQQLLTLLPSDISYDRQSQFAQNLIVRVIRHSANFEIVDLQVKIGYFLFHRISVTYARTNSQTHQQQSYFRGGFCNVYKCQFKGIFLAVKCLQKSRQKQNEEEIEESILGRAIEEYCILKLASCFGVGPKIYGIFGYDIIVYPECIELCMELCSPLPKMDKMTRKRIAKQLKENLLKLHSLSIIHFDIKVENIAFSNVINKYVFLDFGMAKIIKESIGYKSVTTYRGTFNYCSDQMTHLFFLGGKTKKYIDVFFNDLVALKKTFRSVEFRTQICDISLQDLSNDQVQPSALAKDLTKTHKMSILKYNIYQQKYISSVTELKLLQPQEIEEMLVFIQNIKSSFVNKNKYRSLLAMLNHFSSQKQLSVNVNCHQLDHKQKIKAQINSEINKINKPSIVFFYLNQFHQNFSQLLQLLKDPIAIVQMQVLDYCCLLAKAIQVNANTLSLQDLQQICEIGREKLNILNASLKESTKENRKNDQNIVFETSKTLFALAFHNKLIGKYFSVFCSIVNNIFFFELLSSEQLIGYYKVLLQMKMPFENKIVSLIKYNSALVWFYMGTSSQDIYQSLKRKIEQMNEIYCFQASNYHKTEEIQVLKQILLKNKTKQLFISNILGFCKETLLQIQMFCQFKRYNFLTILVDIFQRLRNLQYQLSFYSASAFQYYDFAFLYQSIVKLKPGSTLQISSSLFLKKVNAPVGCLIKGIIAFQRDKNIEKLTNCITNINSYKHQFIIKMILVLLKRGFYYEYQFSKSKQQVQQLYFNLWIQYNCLLVKQNLRPPQSIQYRIQMLFQQLYWQNLLKNIYFQRTGRLFKNIIGIKPGQDFQNLQKQFKKDISKYNICIKNKRLMQWNNFIILLLTIKGNGYQGLRLARIILKLINFIKVDILTKEYMLQMIIVFIFTKANFQNLQKVKDQNKDIYFEHAKIIEKTENELYYIFNGKIFVDILQIMYRFQPKGLFPIISKTLAKLYNYNDRRNTQEIIQHFQWLLIKIGKQQYFLRANCDLQKDFKTVQNPYKVIILFFIIRNKNSSGISKSNFFYIFSLLERVNFSTKQYILRKLYFDFLASHCQQLKQRKRNQINKKIVQYDWLNLSTKQMIKLYISPKSLNSLKCQLNKKKFEKYFKSLDKLRQNIYWTKYENKLRIQTKYKMIIT